MERNNMPQCVGFIMDGNRRWAVAQEKSPLDGHAAGYATFKKVVDMVHTAHIPHMVCYAFSTENWKRAEAEVGYLMSLLERALTELPNLLQTKGKINLRVIGELDALSQKLRETIRDAESKNHDDPELTVWVALSYGGRREIVDAVNRAISAGTLVNEESFGKLLWTHGMPDPDIIIRTSGEVRTSNFLLWQSAYSELFFTKTLWPDFGESEFQSILHEYATRERRKGR